MSAKYPHSTAENGVWRNIQGEWRQLFGSFSREGISIEYHHFRSEKELDWSRSFHADSLEICLNLQGSGVLRGAGRKRPLACAASPLICPGTGSVRRHAHAGRAPSFRDAGDVARLPLAAPRRARVGAGSPGARLRRRHGRRRSNAHADVRPMSMAVQNIARVLAEPPVSAAAPAGRLWYEAKILELLSLLVFAPETRKPNGEMFCDRQKRLGRERVEQACAVLARDLENPPTLEMLAAEVGCGAFHLSRMFSQQVGQTVPQYLRQLRLERAAQLLREGRCNVTEAAMAVGYSSLSHFSKAFWEAYGCCPGLYGNPKLRAAAQKANARRH